jgi:transposase
MRTLPGIRPCQSLLKQGVEYHDLGAEHFTRRDRQKMILRLVRRINDLGCQVQLVPQAA